MENAYDVISLCSMNGNELRPWAKAGYKCVAIDVQNDARREEGENGGFIDFVAGDVYKLADDFCAGAKLAFAFPPCTDLASLGARWWKGKEEKNPGTLDRAIALAARCWDLIQKADAYAMENPVGRLATHWQKWNETFNPCDYGGYYEADDYTKRTCLWTGGKWSSPPKRWIFPKQGSKMHKMPGGGSQKSRNDRSVTPMGWSIATFQHLNGTI